MKSIFIVMTILFLPFVSTSCQRVPEGPAPKVTLTPLSTTPTAAGEVPLPNEKIMILEPAPGSRVVSPVRVSGVADSTFEQTLVVRMLSEDGSEIAIQPAMIRTELGQRGPFEIDLEFAVTGEQQAFIQVFDSSARDGEIIHLSSVGITASQSGPVDIRRVEPGPEQLTIFQPSQRERVQGGLAIVRGYGWASFEQTLVVEVQDENGQVVGSAPVLLGTQEIGQPGHFTAEVPYQVAREGPGRILVRDISPAFGGDVHRTSVEIDLAP